MLRTERDDDWREWMAMNEGKLPTRVHFLYGGSPAFASGAGVMQNGMVDVLRREGHSVRVDIIDSLELADAFVAEMEQPPMVPPAATGRQGGDIVVVVDGIALLFLHAHLAWLRDASCAPWLRGSVAIVHVPFSSDPTYLRERWVREAVPGEHADFAAEVRAREVRCFGAVSRVLAVACEGALGAYGVGAERLLVTSPADDSWKPATTLPRRRPCAKRGPAAAGAGEGEGEGGSGVGGGAFVTVGTLCARKNQLVLLEALALLRDGELPSDWRLHVVGEDAAEPGYAAQLRAAAEGFAGHVVLHGALPQAESFALMARCDAFLFPSRSESFGMAADEAVRIGLPVVAFRGVGPVAALLPPSASVLVADAADGRQWANALRLCCAQLPALQAAAAAEADRREERAGADRREQLPLAQAIHELVARPRRA